MHDIRLIREAPHAFDAALARRGLPPAAAGILKLDEIRRARIAAAEAALAERNAASREVGAAKARGDEAGFERLRALVAEKKDATARLEAEAEAADAGLRELLLGIPNLPYDDVPDGPDETANVEIRRWGSPRNFAHPPLEHFEVPAAKAGLDFEAAARLSGSRFVVMKGAMIRRAPGAGAVHARHPRREARADRGLDPGAGAREGDGRHRPAAEAGRGQLPDHQRLVADPDLGGDADQPRRRPHPRRGRAADPDDRAQPVLPLRGGLGRQGHRRHAAPPPVREGRDGLDHPARGQPRRAASG